MRIGIDLDNTLISYDTLFLRLAEEAGISVPPGSTKETIRDIVRTQADNDLWTHIQGLAYGPRIREAVWMPGAEAFILEANRKSNELFVISHKTPRSAVGDYDLHASARGWMETHQWDEMGLEIGRNVFLEPTREAKFSRIQELAPEVFIDDLPEFLDDPLFPERIRKILFQSNWNEITAQLLEC